MKKWNKTAYIKTILLVIPFFIYYFRPVPDMSEKYYQIMSASLYYQIALSLIFPLIFLPIIAKINFALFEKNFEKPSWNDNPFKHEGKFSFINLVILKSPLVYFQFGAYLIFTTGLSIIFWHYILHQQFYVIGLSPIAMGFGVLGGIWLTVRFSKNDKNRNEELNYR